MEPFEATVTNDYGNTIGVATEGNIAHVGIAIERDEIEAALGLNAAQLDTLIAALTEARRAIS